MPARARTVELKLLGGAGAAVLVVAALTVAIFPPDTAPRQRGSSYAVGPDGAKGAFDALREAGWSIERSIEPISTLRTDPGRTTIVLASPTLPASEQDRAALVRFVTAGGIVLATGEGAAGFYPAMSGPSTRSGPAASARTFVPAVPGPLTDGVSAVRMTLLAGSITADRTAWLPVLVDGSEAGALTMRTGHGRFIWWAATEPLSNDAISAPGHLTLLVNALNPSGDRRILWDEHYHGYGRTMWSYVSATPVAWGLAQLALVAALALFTFGRHIGPVRSRAVIPRTSPLEFVDTMGGLYARVRPAAAAVASALAHVRRRLAAGTALPASSTDEALAAALADRFRVEAQSASRLLRRAALAADGTTPVTERDALSIVAALQRLRCAVESLPRPATASNAAPLGSPTGRRPR